MTTENMEKAVWLQSKITKAKQIIELLTIEPREGKRQLLLTRASFYDKNNYYYNQLSMTNYSDTILSDLIRDSIEDCVDRICRGLEKEIKSLQKQFDQL